MDGIPEFWFSYNNYICLPKCKKFMADKSKSYVCQQNNAFQLPT